MAKVIDLNKMFPEPLNKSIPRGPLPKQKQFMDLALDPNGPKYMAYFGGVGSGKSLVLCATMISQGVMHGGEYVVARQFMPELKRTTYKTFLDLLPPDLLVDHKVALAEVHVRSVTGKPAIFYFVGLDEPDKLRSLNLSGFGIDEASQVSEESFLLLQGRLRNPKGLRKGLMVGNPAGHNWIYSYFVKKDVFNDERIKDQFKILIAPSTENTHLPDGYVQSLLATYSKERVEREIMGSFDAFEGQVYPEFRRDVHVVEPFQIPKNWNRYIGVDHGFRNPSAWVWGAVDGDGNMYIYREFYEKEWLIEEIVKGHKKYNKPGVLQLMKGEKIEGAYIDPSTRATRNERNGEKVSDFTIYKENLPDDFPLMTANNDVTPGIDRVKSYLKVNPLNNKPKLFIFNNCTNLIDELVKYRYQELSPAFQGRQNEKESPYKVDDHACFVAGTKITTDAGDRNIEDIQPGDRVLTRLGFKPVLLTSVTANQPVSSYRFSNGTTLISTPNHPVFVKNDKIAIDTLTNGDDCSTIALWEKSYLMGLLTGRLGRIIGLMGRTAERVLNRFIVKCGSFITDRYLRNTTYTIKTGTQTITTYQISNVSPLTNTYQNTPKTDSKTPPLLQKFKSTWKRFDHWLQNGTVAKLVDSGTVSTAEMLLSACIRSQRSLRYAMSAVETFLHSQLQRIEPSIVTRIVNKQPCGVAEVYNLTVNGPSEYYANGILVSNCDSLRYLLMSQPEIAVDPEDKWAKVKYNSMEGSLIRELERLKKPNTGKDPFGF